MVIRILSFFSSARSSMNLLELILKGEWAEIGKENRSVVYKPLFNVSRIVKWLADVRIKLKICHTGSFLDVTICKKGSTLFKRPSV